MLLKINKSVIIYTKLVSIREYYKDNNELSFDAYKLLFKIYENRITPEDAEREYNKFCDSWNLNPNDPTNTKGGN